jgi:hypothetical protein
MGMLSFRSQKVGAKAPAKGNKNKGNAGVVAADTAETTTDAPIAEQPTEAPTDAPVDQ